MFYFPDSSGQADESTVKNLTAQLKLVQKEKDVAANMNKETLELLDKYVPVITIFLESYGESDCMTHIVLNQVHLQQIEQYMCNRLKVNKFFKVGDKQEPVPYIGHP